MTTFDNVMMGLLVIGLGPLGHLLARAIYLNGSLDKWWLSLIPLFWIPPFSIGAFLAMLWGYVSQGQGEKPFDINLLITFLGTMIVPFIFNTFWLNEGFAGCLIETIMIFLLILIPMYIREKTNCEKENIKKSASWSRVVFNASIAHLIGIIMKIVINMVIDYTPAGLVLKVITAIPMLDQLKDALIYSAGISTAVLGTNMVQATDLAGYCGTDRSALLAGIAAAGSLIFNTSYEYYQNF
jgi:hypothetical protein